MNIQFVSIILRLLSAFILLRSADFSSIRPRHWKFHASTSVQCEIRQTLQFTIVLRVFSKEFQFPFAIIIAIPLIGAVCRNRVLRFDLLRFDRKYDGLAQWHIQKLLINLWQFVGRMKNNGEALNSAATHGIRVIFNDSQIHVQTGLCPRIPYSPWIALNGLLLGIALFQVPIRWRLIRWRVQQIRCDSDDMSIFHLESDALDHALDSTYWSVTISRKFNALNT